jgi:peptide-methionine (S)-S-oxide reductase
MTTETIVLGAGCFWGVEDVLRQQPGVVSTRVGYAGGDAVDPSYEQVCGGATGHAEVVEVRFRPEETTLAELLRFFWAHHAATGRNVGQYRSLVVCSDDQLPTVRAVKAEVEATGDALTTEILVDAPFYEAEEYHQQYYEKGREVVREVRRQCGLPPLS